MCTLENVNIGRYSHSFPGFHKTLKSLVTGPKWNMNFLLSCSNTRNKAEADALLFMSLKYLLGSVFDSRTAHQIVILVGLSASFTLTF